MLRIEEPGPSGLSGSGGSHVRLEDLHLDLSDARGVEYEIDPELEERIAEFKADPVRMRVATEFIDDLLRKAQQDAQIKRNAKQAALDAESGDIKVSIRQWHNRARGFMSRVFAQICNCTKTGGVVSVTKAFKRTGGGGDSSRRS